MASIKRACSIGMRGAQSKVKVEDKKLMQKERWLPSTSVAWHGCMMTEGALGGLHAFAPEYTVL